MPENSKKSQSQGSNFKKVPIFKNLEKFVSNLFDLIDVLGKRVFGELWDLVFESIQDAFSFGVLSFLPNWIILKLTGQDYSDWNSCFIISHSDVDRYFCFMVVAALFAGVITFGLRLLQRFLKSFNFSKLAELINKAWQFLRKDKGNG